MRYNRLGNTGLIVSELCLGAMTFGTRPSRWGTIHGLTQDDANGLVKQAVDAALASGKPTLINAVIDPAAGSESGRIGNLNPQSALKKK